MEDENVLKSKVKSAITWTIAVMVVISLILLGIQAGTYLYIFATKGNEKVYYYRANNVNGFSSYCYANNGLYCKIDIKVNEYEEVKE